MTERRLELIEGYKQMALDFEAETEHDPWLDSGLEETLVAVEWDWSKSPDLLALLNESNPGQNE